MLDILAAIQKIRHFTAGLTVAEFEENIAVRVVLALMLIGEAANNLPLELQAAEPDIPWGDIRDMRNFLIHEYFKIRYQIIWSVVVNDLAPLEAALLRLLGRADEHNV